jgi:hypothetical protein
VRSSEQVPAEDRPPSSGAGWWPHLVRIGSRAGSSRRVAWAVAGIAIVVAAVAILVPSGGERVAPTAAPFDGIPQVGALFRDGSDTGVPFCTASVVDSPKGDLLATAAHCLSGPPDGWVFVPMYHDGQDPYGVWSVRAAYVSHAWVAGQDPHDDFAFLTVSSQLRDGEERTLESVVGADRFVAGTRPPQWTVVIGYPAQARARPIICLNQTFERRGYSAFRCDGFVDGVSGGPWLVDYNTKRTRGEIYGVTGGRKQGGCLNFVSFTSGFDADAADLYHQAATGDEPQIAPDASKQSC